MQIETIEDLLRILQEHPDWRMRVREVLLTEEERQLPAQMAQLVAAVRELTQAHREGIARLELLEASHREAIARLDRLEQSHERLWESHQELVQSHQAAIARLERLEQSHQELVQSHQEGLNRLARLEQIVERISRTVEQLLEWSRYAERDIGRLKGISLELQYYNRAPALFGYYVKRPRVVNVGHLLDELREQGHTFTEEEWNNLAAIDVLLSARHPKTDEKIYLAIEVSWMLYPDDVERAYQRAELLRARGLSVYPAVAGEGITPDARERVQRYEMMLLLDGVASHGGLIAREQQ